ncbi:MAG TPA: hypothetical protein VGM93_00290 [Acidimicrobiales bacterium]
MYRETGGSSRTARVTVRSGESSLGDELIEAGAGCGRWQHRLVHLAAEFDDSGEWALDGAVTCAHWIAGQLDVEVCTAREWVRIGHLLATLPLIDAAFGDGRLSFSKVRALTRVATGEFDAELLALALRTPAGRLARALAAWLVRNEEPEDTEDRQHRGRGAWWHTDPDGMRVITLRLPPLAGGIVTATVDCTVMGGADGDRLTQSGNDATAVASGSTEREILRPTLAQQRADALVQLMAGALDETGSTGPVGDGRSAITPELIIHVRADGCSLDDGTPLADTVAERIAPQSFIRMLIHDAERRPINASGRHRHPTTRQKRVVKERDRCCVDCDCEVLLENDHDPSFGISKRTVVDELKLRCHRCHRERHRKEDEAAGRSTRRRRAAQ